MNIQQVTMTTFVLLHATWTVEKGRQLIERLKPSHVIVHSHDPQDGYYLFSAHEVRLQFAHTSIGLSIREAIRLSRRSKTPTIESTMDAEQAPDQCIVLENGRLIGFFDVTVPPQWITSHRGGNGPLSSKEPEVTLRSLVAACPEQVQQQTVFSLLVALSASPPPEAGVVLPVALPLGTTVDIVVQNRDGFVLEGMSEGTLVISSEEETLPLQFKLRGVAVGLGQVRVLAFHLGQPLGALTLNVKVLESSVPYPVPHLNLVEPLEPVNVHQPDLSLVIFEDIKAGQPAFTFRLTALDSALGLNIKSFGPIQLRVDALHYFRGFFKDIETLPFKTNREKAIAQRRLETKGTTLFTSLLPEDLQQLLWSLRSRIQSVQVQSEEPWIPWELCKLCGREDGRVIEGPFFCENFAITRWLPELSMKPRLQLNNMAVVMPANSKLDFASSERDYLLSLANGNRRVSTVPATFLELLEAFASGQYDGWHFTGHGGFCEEDPDKSVIYLEDQEQLTPMDLSGKVSNLGKAKPLVFLNACQIGRSAMSLTGIGGWAKRFLDAGAGAFIGPYWSVDDKPAHDFAHALYSKLLIGVPIGKAVQEARIAIKSSGNPTWLAYTVFADPLAITHYT